MRILTKILIAVLGVTIVGAWALGLIVNSNVAQVIQTMVGLNQEQAVRQVLQNIDQTLYARYQEIKTIAASEETATALSVGGVKNENYWSDLRWKTGPWDILTLYDDKHQVLKTTQGVQSLDFKKNPTLALVYERAKQGTISYSDVIKSPDTGKLTLIMAAPVYGLGDNKFQAKGVVVGQLAWTPIIEELSSWRNGQLHLFDRSGTLIASDNAPAHQEMEKNIRLISNFINFPAVERAINTEDTIMQEGSIHDGKPSFIAHAHEGGYLDYQGNGWFLMLETPTQVALSPIADIMLRFTAFGWPLLALISCTVLFVLYWVVVVPIEELTKTTKSLADGDLRQQVNIKSADEIGILGNSFNKMTERIREMMQEVRQQTKQLQVHKELKKRYVYMSSLQELLTKLTYTINVKIAMQAMAVAMRKLSTTFNISYLINVREDVDSERILYVDTVSSVTPNYLEAVQQEMVSCLNEFREVKNKAILQQQLNEPLHVQFLNGHLNRTVKKHLSKSVLIPVVTLDNPRILGIFHIGWSETNISVNNNLIQFLQDMINVAALNIGRIESLIRSEQSHINDLIQSMSNGVAMFDLKQNVIVANPVVMKLVEIGQCPFHLSNLVKLFQESMVDWNEKIASVLAKGEIIHLAEVNYGRLIYEIFVTPVRDSGHKIIGGAMIFHDITHIKEVDRMKTDFVSLASHQLRTPLTIINWYLEMMRAGDVGEFSPEQHKYIDEVYNESKRMVALVSDLLNVSRIETGRLQINREPIDIIKFLKEIVEQTATYGSAQNCAVVLHEPSDVLPQLQVDVVLMRQVLHNLIVNAIEYYPGKDPHAVNVIVEKTMYEKNNREGETTLKEYVLIKIVDQGIGISKEVKKQIFSKFFRAENARKVKPDGTGLGLYIAKSIVEISGGHIWFETEEGKGTTFFVLLPLEPENKNDQEQVV